MPLNLKVTPVFDRNWKAIHAVNADGKRKYRYIVNRGSSRSSKTYSLIDCCDLYGRSNTNKRITVWRDTKTDCVKTVLNDVIKHLKSTGRWMVGCKFHHTTSILTYQSGSTFEIHGTDDDTTVHGLTQQVAWLNEPYKISRDVFDQIDQRTSDFIFIDYNPKMGHWVEDLMKDPRCIVIDSTFRDNPFCPEEQRNKILSYQPVKLSEAVINKLLPDNIARTYDCIDNPASLPRAMADELMRCQANEDKRSASEFKWQVYGMGLKAEKPNRIFNWGEISLQEYLSIDVTEYYATDFGSVDPFALISAKYYDGALYLRELNYESENQIRERLTPTERQQIEGIDEGLVSWVFQRAGVNPNGYVVCDNNRPLKILALRSAGYEYALSAVKGPGSVVDGIDLLNNIRVYFTSDSENLRYEQENYSRQVDRYGVVLEEPEDFDNHLMDCARYIATFLQSEGIISKV